MFENVNSVTLPATSSQYRVMPENFLESQLDSLVRLNKDACCKSSNDDRGTHIAGKKASNRDNIKIGCLEFLN